MLFLYYIFFIILLSVLGYFIYKLLFRKKSVALVHFVEALKNENAGYYEAAVDGYKIALAEQQKLRFHNGILTTRIREKIKLLHTIISYDNNFHPSGQDKNEKTDFFQKSNKAKSPV